MNVHFLLGLSLAALAVAILAYVGVKGALAARARLKSESAGGSTSFLRQLLAPFAAFVLRRRGADPELDRTLRRYERLIVQADRRFLGGADAAEVFVARFVLPLLALAGLTALLPQLGLSSGAAFLVALVFAAMLYLWPEQALADLARKRVQAFSRALPQTLDVMRLVSQSGGDLAGALRTAVEVSPDGPVREELSRVVGEVTIGASLAQALTHVAERIDSPDANAVFSTMAQALEMGTSVADNLGQASALIRKAARTKAQERAQKAVVAMTFPLLLLILPGVFIVLFAPLVIQYASR